MSLLLPCSEIKINLELYIYIHRYLTLTIKNKNMFTNMPLAQILTSVSVTIFQTRLKRVMMALKSHT
jgi:hypothetical protein